MTISTCDLCDQDPTLQSVNLPMRDFGGRIGFSGKVRTVRCYRDNSLVKELVATDGEGAVLVIDGAGSMDCALLGDMVAATAVNNGWAGIIVNAAVRDSAELAKLDLGIKALGTNPRKSFKTDAGAVDVEVSFGSVVFRPGLMLHADQDGIVVEAIG